MKFTLATLTTLLALSSVSEGAEWVCGRQNGPSNNDKKRAVEDFDKLFGKRMLKAAKNQCYVSVCRGNYFKFCARGGVGRTEKEGQRGQAKSKGLPHGKGSNCRIVGLDHGITYNYHQYGFGKWSDVDDCMRQSRCGGYTNDIRKC